MWANEKIFDDCERSAPPKSDICTIELTIRKFEHQSGRREAACRNGLRGLQARRTFSFLRAHAVGRRCGCVRQSEQPSRTREAQHANEKFTTTASRDASSWPSRRKCALPRGRRSRFRRPRLLHFRRSPLREKQCAWMNTERITETARALRAKLESASLDGRDRRLRNAALLGEIELRQLREFSRDAHHLPPAF